MKLWFFIPIIFAFAGLDAAIECPIKIAGTRSCYARQKIAKQLEESLRKIRDSINAINSERRRKGCRCNPTIPATLTCGKICGRLNAMLKAQRIANYTKKKVYHEMDPMYIAEQEDKIFFKISQFRKNRPYLRDRFGLPLDVRPSHDEKFKWNVVRRDVVE